MLLCSWDDIKFPVITQSAAVQRAADVSAQKEKASEEHAEH
jgi:hypothetical protein